MQKLADEQRLGRGWLVTKRMIFHHPEPVRPEGNSGSQIRPVRMIDAFRQLGYEVDAVVGYAADRRRVIKRVIQRLKAGEEYDFVYAESSTTPTLLTEPHHIPTSPTLDFGFLKLLRRMGVAAGIFYRDVYWRFDSFVHSTSWLKRAAAVPFYRYDWRQYCRLFDYLYLPSLAMKEALPTPWPDERIVALPPGCVVRDVGTASADRSDGRIRLLYVGGVKPPDYDFRTTVDCISQTPGVSLTICSRKAEWEQVRTHYAVDDRPNIRVVHAQGGSLDQLYAEADILMLVRNVSPYLKLAMPVKVFESLGHGVPIIASGDTEAGRFVQHHQIGWVVNSEADLVRLLSRLQEHPAEIETKRLSASSVRHSHKWTERAGTVVETLANLRRTALNRQQVTSV